MHLTRIHIENVRALRDLEWSIQPSQGAGWHVLVGDNGAGKSTMLAAVAVALLGPRAAMQLRKRWGDWVTWKQDKGRVRLDVQLSDIDEPVASTTSFGVEFYREAKGAGKVEVQDPSPPDAVWNSDRGWFSASYGPFRRLSGGESAVQEFAKSFPKVGRHISLFEEGVALTDVLGWLQQLQFKSLEESPEGELLNPLINFVNHDDFLPFGTRLDSISSSGVRFVDGNDAEVQLADLSGGFRSILSMTLELVRQLSMAYGPENVFDNDDPSKIICPGVVLVDEIDVHLHPTWQQQVGLWFRRHFPNMQFIVTTHSPLVCQASSIGTVYRLPHQGSDITGGMVSETELDRLVYGNVLDAFGTGVFGDNVVRSAESTKALDRLAQLNVKEMDHELSEVEMREQEELRRKLPSRTHELPGKGRNRSS